MISHFRAENHIHSMGILRRNWIYQLVNIVKAHLNKKIHHTCWCRSKFIYSKGKITRILVRL